MTVSTQRPTTTLKRSASMSSSNRCAIPRQKYTLPKSLPTIDEMRATSDTDVSIEDIHDVLTVPPPEDARHQSFFHENEEEKRDVLTLDEMEQGTLNTARTSEEYNASLTENKVFIGMRRLCMLFVVTCSLSLLFIAIFLLVLWMCVSGMDGTRPWEEILVGFGIKVRQTCNQWLECHLGCILLMNKFDCCIRNCD